MMMTMMDSTIDLPERMQVLFHQEATIYRTDYYLRVRAPTFVDAAIGGSQIVVPSYDGMDPTWRERMVEWAYSVTDHFDFSREIVAFCMNLVDRYIARYNEADPCGIDTWHLQLLVMSCLIVAVKINRPIHGTLSMNMMLHLCRHQFSKRHLIAMEHALFNQLSWQLHPPTPSCFMRHFLLQVPIQEHDTVVDLARFWIELSVCDYFFVAFRPSAIALAALVNSVRHVEGGKFSPTIVQLEGLVPLQELGNVRQCQGRLWSLYEPAELGNDDERQQVLAESPAPQSRDNIRTISPVSVTDFL